MIRKYRSRRPAAAIIGRKGGSTVFSDVRAPGLGSVKVMSRDIFERATREANNALHSAIKSDPTVVVRRGGVDARAEKTSK